MLSHHTNLAVQRAQKKLAAIGAGLDASPTLLLNALAECLPVAACVITTVRAGPYPILTNHAIGLPSALLESWISTPNSSLDKALRPVFCSAPGNFWRDADLHGGLPVVNELDAFGLGEGAGWKLYQRGLSDLRTEHGLLAMLTERNARFPQDSADVLHHLKDSVNSALARMRLPLVMARSLEAQMMEEQHLGFLCVSMSGSIIEANRRAYELASAYHATSQRKHELLHDFLRHVHHFLNERHKLDQCRPVVFLHSDKRRFLEVNRHFLAKETHTLFEDIFLFELREVILPEALQPQTIASPVLNLLTQREREIALLLVETGFSNMEIADHLHISPHTARTLVNHVYRKVGVHSRPELVALLRPKKSF